MKKNNVTYLHIASPCDEGWEQMIPDAQGRFCGSCQKTVIDFTQMSDAQVLATISKAAAGCCGRFQNDQLDRPIYAESHYRVPFLPAMVLASMLILAVPVTLHAQQKATVTTPVKKQVQPSIGDTVICNTGVTAGMPVMVPPPPPPQHVLMGAIAPPKVIRKDTKPAKKHKSKS